MLNKGLHAHVMSLCQSCAEQSLYWDAVPHTSTHSHTHAHACIHVLTPTPLISTLQVFQHPLAFNVIPHIDAFQKNGYTKEEMKVAWEMQKIFDLPAHVKVPITLVGAFCAGCCSRMVLFFSRQHVQGRRVRLGIGYPSLCP